MDNLTTMDTGLLSISGNYSLTTISFKSLNTISANSITTGGNSIYITNCPLLSNLNLNALTSLGGKLTLSGININDLSAFSSLQSVGALNINNNPALTSFNGMERLTSLTSAALTTSMIGSVFNGIYITNNTKLTSLSGLQNIIKVPVASITGNVVLSDLCSFRAPITALSQLPAYQYSYNSSSGDWKTGLQPALVMTKNGSYATTADALAAVALCK